MAAIFSLAGGIIGFALAIAALVVLEASIALAFAIWSCSGLTVVALGVVLSFRARRPVASKTRQISDSAHPA